MLKRAATDHPIHDLLAERWSAYAFEDRPVADADLRSLFEAARWAPSSRNEQPWRYIVATKDEPTEFERLLSCLTERNQIWAQAAPALALSVLSLSFEHNAAPNRVAAHDLGLATANLIVEATSRGLSVHPMAGILPERARETYRIPEGFEAFVALAIGYRGDPAGVPEPFAARDSTPRVRRALRDFVFAGAWGEPSRIVRGV